MGEMAMYCGGELHTSGEVQRLIQDVCGLMPTDTDYQTALRILFQPAEFVSGCYIDHPDFDPKYPWHKQLPGSALRPIRLCIAQGGGKTTPDALLLQLLQCARTALSLAPETMFAFSFDPSADMQLQVVVAGKRYFVQAASF